MFDAKNYELKHEKLKKIELETKLPPLCHPGVKRPEYYLFWRLTPTCLPIWAFNAQPDTLAGL